MSAFLNLLLLLRSLWSACYISLITLAAVPFGGTSRKKMDRRLYGWAESTLKYAQLKVQVKGLESIQILPGQRYVIMCNHSSLYDIPISMEVFKDYGSIRMIVKKELFRVPIWGWAMRFGEFVSIDREDRHQAVRDIERAKQLLETGVMYWIAPEGTRSPDGNLGEFKSGGVKLAMDMDAWIIPIGIQGAFEVMSKNSLHVNTGKEVIVHVGKPILTQGMERKQRKQLTQQIRDEIEQLLCRPKPIPELETSPQEIHA